MNRNGKGTITENEIYDNQHFGVSVTTQGYPYFERNKIHSNGKTGILCIRRLVNYLILYYSGVRIFSDTFATLKNNTVINNNYAGIEVFSDTATVSDNIEYGNKKGT